MNISKKLRFLFRLRARVMPLFDMSAWVLLVVSCVPLYFINPAMLLTLAQWTAFALALGGIAVVLCRVLLPSVELGFWLDRARALGDGTAPGAIPAAIVVFGVLHLLGFLFLGLVLWAKA